MDKMIKTAVEVFMDRDIEDFMSAHLGEDGLDLSGVYLAHTFVETDDRNEEVRAVIGSSVRVPNHHLFVDIFNKECLSMSLAPLGVAVDDFDGRYVDGFMPISNVLHRKSASLDEIEAYLTKCNKKEKGATYSI